MFTKSRFPCFCTGKDHTGKCRCEKAPEDWAKDVLDRDCPPNKIPSIRTIIGDDDYDNNSKTICPDKK